MKQQVAVAHIFLSLKIGGMEKVGIDLIKNMDQEKYKHYILCLGELGPLGRELKKEGFPIYALNKSDGIKFSIIPKIIHFLKKNNIKIVHTNNPSPHLWGGVAAWLAGVKLRIHTKHGRNFINIKRKVYVNRLSSIFSNKIVSVSKDSAELTQKIERVPKKKISIIYNGVDTEYFKRMQVKTSLYREFGINKNDFVIGSVSRFSVDKDYETLIKAFNELLKEKRNIFLLLVGDGETKQQMINLVNDLNIQEKVSFIGSRSDIVDILNIIDIFVLSTHTEGISIALLEAMAAERVVVATNVGGNGEIIKNTENGYLVAENNYNELKEILQFLLDNKKERERLAKTARESVIINFSIKNTVVQYERLYEELLLIK